MKEGENSGRREFLKNMGILSAGLFLTGPGAFAAEPEHDAPASRRDYILTKQVFDSKYNAIEHAAEDVAELIFPLSLQDAADKDIVTRYMKDLALPLGIYTGHDDVNFYRGMKDMWNDKRGIKDKTYLQKERDHFLREIKSGTTKSSLRKYRRKQIAHSTDVTLKELHENKRGKDGSYFSGFMKEITDFITPNVLLAYNIQELLPPNYNGMAINPVFKEYFLDKLFKEAGEEFIEGYPARYDPYMSFGPFQMTYRAMPNAFKLNKYVSKEDRIPQYVQQMDGLQEHTNAGAMLAYHNWEYLSHELSKHGLLKKFDRMIDSLTETEKQTLISGITACMHHLPGKTATRVANYTDQRNAGHGMHYRLRRESLTPQLQKYYDSSAEAYLTLKVFHTLDNAYSR